MRRQEFLLMTALVITIELVAANLSACAQQKAVESSDNSESGLRGSSRLITARHKGNEPLEQTFQDTIHILSKKNSCSRFFGEPKTSEKVLNRLSLQLRIRPLGDSRTGIEMSGNFTYFVQTQEHAGYRMFAAATINSEGPFFKAKNFAAEPYVPWIGRFRPNTREARVLMLLHELAHLLEGQNGNWLIPDDGNSPGLSLQNTQLIESQCKDQILRLSEVARDQVALN